MLLRYKLSNGREETVRLENRRMTIGRGLNVDLVIQDRLASRLHCCIEFKDGAWHVQDMNSRNGVYVNEQRIQSSPLKPGDRIRIGETVLVCEKATAKGTETVIRELNAQMEGGKGFKTMLIEIVGNGQDQKRKHTDRIRPV